MKHLYIIYSSSRTIQFFIGSLHKEFVMGDKGKSKISNGEMENLSLDSSRYPRDFLTRFSGWREGDFGAIKEEGCGDDEEEEGIELNLGLSLGGRLGVDKGSMKLIRSSSIAECLPIVKDEDYALTSSPSPAVAYSRLVRTTSLPLGSDEELRKRKELQTLRRMEAKKRRSEKQRNLKGEREEGGSQLQEEKRETIELNLRGRIEKDRVFEAAKRNNSLVAPPFGSPSRAADGSRETVPQGGIVVGGAAKGKGMQEFVESQGGSSSEMDNRSLPTGTGNSSGDTSSGNIRSMQESSNQDVGCSSGTKTRENLGRTSSLDVENPSRQTDTTRSNQPRETRANPLEDMPSVFTKGDGPNGRRVDGILYKYGRGEEVRIMCVCHGEFHSPAEFVKHAGGTDITHPLKHIVVNPNTTPFT